MPYVTLAGDGRHKPLSIRYRSNGSASHAGTLILIHELGGSLETLSTFAELMSAGLRVVTYDQRGAGGSEHTAEAFSVEDLADDVDRIAKALDLSGPVHLMGLAMGAVVALRYALRHGGSLASLTLCDATGEITPEARSYLLDRAAAVRTTGMRAVADASFKNAFRGLQDPFNDPRWTEYRHRFLNNAPQSYAMHSAALAAAQFDDEELAGIVCPTLMMTGRHDFIWPPEVGRRLAARIPTASFHEIEDAAHFPLLQSAERSVAVTTSFLKANAATSSR